MGDSLIEAEPEMDIEDHLEYDPYREQYVSLEPSSPESMILEPDNQRHVRFEPINQDNVINVIGEDEENILEDTETRNRDLINLGGDPSYNVTIGRNAKINWWINKDGELTNVEELGHDAVEGISEGTSVCWSSGEDTCASSAGALIRKRVSLSELDKGLRKIFSSNKPRGSPISFLGKTISSDYSRTSIEEKDEGNQSQTALVEKLVEKVDKETQTDQEIEYVIEVSEDLRKDCFATKETNAIESSDIYLENEEEYIVTKVFIHINEIRFDKFYWNKKNEYKCKTLTKESSSLADRVSNTQTKRRTTDSQFQECLSKIFTDEYTDASSGEEINTEERVIAKVSQLQKIDDLTSRIESHCANIKESLKYSKEYNRDQILPDLRRIKKYFEKNTPRLN